jgi:tol-pal system protein YbgF
MRNKHWLPFVVATGLAISTTACAERAEVVEYNPNVPTQVPTPAATPEVGMLGYVNGKFNRMDRQLEDSADRMDRLERDVDRLKALEDRVAALEKKLAAASLPPAAASTTSADDTAAAKPALSAAETEAAQAAYKKAFDQLMAGKYPEAGKLFKNYLDQYPDTDQSGNAYYWLGETYFVDRKFELAAKAFTQSAKLDSPKAADALVKSGQCYVELNKTKEAKAAFDEVKKRFPDTAAAKQADKGLAILKTVGDTKK